MVFGNDGQSLSFGALLSSIGAGSVNPPAREQPAPAPTTTARPPPPRPTSTTGSRPPVPIKREPVAPARPSSQSKPQTQVKKPSTITPSSSAGQKRKVDEISRPASKPASTTSVRPAKPLVKPSANASSTAAATAAKTNANPTASSTLKKGSWKEIMARAAEVQKAGIVAPGTIVHKPKVAVKEKKEWQKKLAEERAAKERAEKMKSEKGAPPASGKVAAGSRAGKKEAPQKPEAPARVIVKAPSILDRIPGAKRPTASRPLGGASRRTPEGRPPSPKRTRREESYSSRYRYVEDYSDYSDESDMEATGFDILEEEEFSTRNAIKEDLEEQKKEEEHARRKALLKKRLAKG